MKKDLDILMVGHFAKDKIVVDGKEEICAGGAVYYGAVVLKRLGLEVGVAAKHGYRSRLLSKMNKITIEN